ncbi:hypothetical protein CW734_13530 [Planococcus sp. MB-3u-03]|nr:hypothetical protein CW734_13530 [Planococcus sp. MB-3u-03]
MLIGILIQYTLNFTDDVENFSFITTWDKNYTGVILFLFFLFCQKPILFRKVLVIVSVFIVGSRGLLLMVFILFNQVYEEINFSIETNCSFKKTVTVLIILTLSSFIFSLFWTNYVASTNVQDYQEGLNDSSNKIRF